MKVFAFAVIVTLVSVSSANAGSLTPVADLKRGSMVSVEGVVERILDEDEFRLADDTGSVRVYVGPNWVPVNAGERVRVQGFVDDGIGPREIYARMLTREDGTDVEFSHRYY